MKTYLIIVLIFFSLFAHSQDRYTLDWSRKKVIENYPEIIKKSNDIEISKKEIANLKTAFLPQINLSSQFSYQSDVPSVNMPDNLGFNINSPSKDQYKIELDVQQILWDGGLTKSKIDLAKTKAGLKNQELKISVYALNKEVIDIFFLILITKENILSLNKAIEILEKRITEVESAIRNGVLNNSAHDKLLAEKLSLFQSRTEMKSGLKSAVSILSTLTGEKISESGYFLIPENSTVSAQFEGRPEYQFFNLRDQQIEKSIQLIEKNRFPKLFAFGKAGYGNPGINLFNDEFDTYYIVGAGLKWNVWDWNRTSRNKEIYHLKKDNISASRNNFELIQKKQLAALSHNIKMYEQLMQTSTAIVELKSKIAIRSASELKNGTITTADYINDLNNKVIAEIKYNTYKINLIKVKTDYKFISGNL